MLYLLYRAMWTLSALRYARVNPTQNNINVVTAWSSNEIEMREEQQEFGIGAWKNHASTPIADFLHGWPIIYLLPYILISPGFYYALLGKKWYGVSHLT